MSAKMHYASEFSRGTEETGQSSPVTMLAVGEPDEWQQQGKHLPRGAIAFVAFRDITAELLDHLVPTVIVSPVLAPSFDCIELATLLHHLDYPGSYRAVSNSLPKPELIEREVRQVCDRLDFRIVKSN